jgi:hypothetical protein
MTGADAGERSGSPLGPQHRLAVYGTLGPGGPNHHILADLDGRWIDGTVRGHLREEGWGSELGYPGIVLDPDGPEVPPSERSDASPGGARTGPGPSPVRLRAGLLRSRLR